MIKISKNKILHTFLAMKASYTAGTSEPVWFGIQQTQRINGKCSWGLFVALAQLLRYKSEIQDMKKIFTQTLTF